MVPFHVRYGFLVVCYIVNLSIWRAVFFRQSISKKCRDLEIGVKGHSRSLKMVPFDRLYIWFSYYCPIVTLSVRRTVLRYSTSKCRELENPVMGPCGLLKISPFNRAHMTSYWRSIMTIALSRVIFEIFNVEKYCDLEIPVKGQSRSLKVVPFDRQCMVSY